MPLAKRMLTQQELDFRLLNIFLLKEERGNAVFPKVSLLGRSGIYVGVSPRNYFPVYINIANDWFRLGSYTSEELETNPKIKLSFPDTTYLNYQDLLNFFHETKRLKVEYGKLDENLVRSYHLYLPSAFPLTIAHIREIYSSCTTYTWKRKPSKLLDELKKNHGFEKNDEIKGPSESPEPTKKPPKPAQFFEIKEDEEVIAEIREKEQKKPESVKLSKKEVQEELEDLDIQMRLLKLEKEQILLQQRINKLKRA